MPGQYKEYQKLNLPGIGQEILNEWKAAHTFQKSIDLREGNTPFVFYEGPPSANGLPGIHHVISRTLKDLVCRYKTMQGFQVKEKAVGIHTVFPSNWAWKKSWDHKRRYRQEDLHRRI